MTRTYTIALTLLAAMCSGTDAPATMGAAAAMPVDSVRCAALRPADSLTTSIAGFIAEVLDAKATSRTPRFNAYDTTSYSVDKGGLASALSEIRRACGIPLQEAVILGPVGPLWTYHVVTVQRLLDGSARVNSVVMPHARITYKATAAFPAAAADSFFTLMRQSPLLRPLVPVTVRPASADSGESAGKGGIDDLLVLEWRGDSVTMQAAQLRDANETAADGVLRPINAMLARLLPTYPDSATRARRERDER